jgi:hypothetical protein
MRFFEVKVKYDKMLETGAVKTVTETYALDALSFTEAEAKITDQMRPFIQGSFEVTAEKIAPYTNLIRGDGDLYYQVKYTFTSVNEITGAESKKHLETILINAEDFDEAKAKAVAYQHECVLDWQIDTLKETSIVDVFTDLDNVDVTVEAVPRE